MTSKELRKLIEDFEKNPYYLNTKRYIHLGVHMLHTVELTKLKLAEMEREEMNNEHSNILG